MTDNYFSELLSIKYQQNKEMLKIILESIPANVFFKDTKCRYQLASHVCEMLNMGGDEWTIIGKTDLEVQKDPSLARFYYEDDKKIIRTRKGSHYISEMAFKGEKYYYEITKEPVIDFDGNLMGIIGLVIDVTELKRLQEEMRVMSITDKLTGAYNRTYFEQKLASLKESGAAGLSVIMFDANGLKFFNDKFGHGKGDALLIETVRAAREALGDAGEVMRIGGDEFIVLLYDCPEERCIEMVSRMKERERDCSVSGLPVSNSYGYAAVKGKSRDPESAIKLAEERMYAEKSGARDGYIQRLRELCAAGSEARGS